MNVGYFTNQYPKISHTFIRREIAAVENLGTTVERWAIRGWDAEIADPLDAAEQQRTRYLLRGGAIPLLTAAFLELLRTPKAWFAALRLSFRMMKRSDRGPLLHLITFLEGAMLSRGMQAAKLDHLHTHFGTNAAEIAMIASCLSGVPYSMTVHGQGEFDAPVALKLNLKVARSAFVVAITNYCASQLYRWADVADWDKIHVVHCGLSQAFLEQVPTPVPAVPHFVNVGRLDQQKGHLILIEAVARLRAAGTPVHVTLVGDGDARGQLEAAIARLGIAQDVTITGWADEAAVRAHIVAARAMVMPSFAEGLPIVVMEALALGRPVLASNVAAMADLVVNGETGWLFSPGSVDAVTRAMADCIATPVETCTAMGERGRALIRDRHDASREARKIYDLMTAHKMGHKMGHKMERRA